MNIPHLFIWFLKLGYYSLNYIVKINYIWVSTTLQKKMPEILILNKTLKHSIGCAAAFKKNRSLVTFQKTNKTFSANITFPSFKFKTWIFRIFFCLRLSLTEKDSLSCKRISPFPLRWWYFHLVQEYLRTRIEIVC